MSSPSKEARSTTRKRAASKPTGEVVPFPAKNASKSRPQKRKQPERVPVKAGSIEPSQIGVADFLIERHGDDMLHVMEGGRSHAWFVWGERGWVKDYNDAQVYRWVIAIGTEMKTAAADLLLENKDDPVGKALAVQAKQLRSNTGVEQVVRAAQRLRRPKTMDDWDTDGKALGCTNGVLYLLDHAPFYKFVKWADVDRSKALMMRNTGVEFNARAAHELWDSALDTFLPDRKVRDALGAVICNVLLDGNPDGLFLVLIGPGNSGKSAVANAIKAALGVGAYGYGGVLDASVFRGGGSGPHEAKAMVMRKRIAVASELDKQQHIHADVVKSMTGGDGIHFNAKYKAGEERVPDFLPVAVANSGMQIKGADAPVRNRLVAIPFKHPQPNKDGRPKELQEDPDVKSAVLAWLVKCWVKRQRDGLPTMPRAVVTETEKLFSGSSLVNQFIEEACEVEPERSSRKAERDEVLWPAFVEWMDLMEVRRDERIDGNKFKHELAGLGFKSGTSRHVRGREGEVTRARCGLRLKVPGKAVKARVTDRNAK